MTLQSVIEQALKLPTDERIELLDHLLDSLDAQWAEVVDRRLQEALEGRVTPVDASIATARAREEVTRRRP